MLQNISGLTVAHCFLHRAQETRCVFEQTSVLPIEELIERERNQGARRIQTAWRLSISSPDYKKCRDRLLREACELSGINIKKDENIN